MQVRSNWWLTLAILWACPTTLLGLSLGALGLLTGTRVRRRGHTLEFYGGLITWLLRRTPVRAAAMTLGHVVIGRDPVVLDRCRKHEWVHVRQYEIWGPLFLPAYLLCSAWLWWQGRNPHLENPFEIEAFAIDTPQLADLQDSIQPPPSTRSPS